MMGTWGGRDLVQNIHVTLHLHCIVQTTHWQMFFILAAITSPETLDQESVLHMIY